MLLGVSTMFIVLTLPLVLFNMFWNEIGLGNYTLLMILHKSLYLIYFLNTAINFWIYAAIGPKFRKELKLLFCWRCLTSSGYSRDESIASTEIK